MRALFVAVQRLRRESNLVNRVPAGSRDDATRRDRWDPNVDDAIRNGYEAGATLTELSRTFGRGEHAIGSKLRLMDLIPTLPGELIESDGDA